MVSRLKRIALRLQAGYQAWLEKFGPKTTEEDFYW